MTSRKQSPSDCLSVYAGAASTAIGTAYNSAGQGYLHTSYSNAAATTVGNQDQDVYNGLSQMIGQYQAITGAMNTASTPEVQWGYSTLANGSRKSDIIYPNGQQVDYNYASGLDSSISRLTSMSDDATNTVLESEQNSKGDTEL